MSRKAAPAYAPLYRTRPASRWTNGDLAAKVGADLGIPPDAEQRELLDMIYAEKAPDRPAAFQVCAVAPRQNIKTSTLLVAAIADMFVFGVEKHLWSAQVDDTAKGTFRDAQEWLTRNPEYADQVQFYEGHQDRAIVHRATGNRIDFGSRTGKNTRGLTGVKRVTLDEALYLRQEHMGAILPTMLTRPEAQVRIASSAGMEKSDVLRDIRDRGRKGNDPRLAYVEYGALFRPCHDEKCLHLVGTPGCALDDRELWWQSNCALWCGRIEEGALEDQRNSLPPEEFMREFLSWWEDPLSLGGAISPESWGALVAGIDQPDDIPAIGLGGSPDGMFGAIGAASVLDDGRVMVAPVGKGRQRGQRWLVEEAARIQKDRGCAVVVASRGPLKYLIPDLQEAGVNVTQRDASEWVDACEVTWQHIEAGTLAHPGDKGLNDSALSAAWKKTGDRRAFARDSMSPLIEAVSLAAHACAAQRESVYESRGALVF